MSSPIQTSAAYQSFVAEPYTPNIGATLHGLDLSQPLSDRAQTELKAALAGGFNRSMQHTNHRENGRSVADEATTKDLLFR